MKPLTRALLTIFSAGPALAQPVASGPTFVAADVHITPKDELSFNFQTLTPGRRIAIRGASMTHIIAMAYGVDDDKISGGPKWLDADKFDIIAKPPSPAAKPAELQLMLQALLAERFGLQVKKEERKFPVYVWSPAKNGLQLKPSKSETDGNCDHPDDNSANRICTGMTVERLGQQLRVFASGYFDRDVIDHTGAAGRYDFTLKWSGKALLGHMPDAISLYDVLEKQYGIKTDPDSIALPAIVVESINETPAPNPPGTDAAMPPMPTEFEVSDIKINKDPQRRENFRFVGGRIDATAVPMKDMIEFAYGVEDDDGIVGGPSWIDRELYDIVAKTDPGVDIQGVQPMLQKLLADRFHLQVHRDRRPMTVYALTVLKNAKLTPGNPAARGNCKISVGNGMRTYACENTSMADFADKVQHVAAGYLDHPVVDLTGLKGVYDFSFSFNGVRVTRPQAGRGGDATGGATGVAVDPGGGITFFTGIEKIGLKMTKEKQPMMVLVIDTIDRAPTEN